MPISLSKPPRRRQSRHGEAHALTHFLFLLPAQLEYNPS
jgi:hypothetical protein